MYLMSTKIKHPNHLVEKSPWSLLILICIWVLVILIILLDLLVSVYLYQYYKGGTRYQIWSWPTYWRRLYWRGSLLGQEHHIDHWYWWDRIKENNSENADNKSSNNPDDNGDLDKNNKNQDSDKNNSPSNTDSKGERSRGS